MIKPLKPLPGKEIPFIIFSSFLGLYLFSRIFIYLFPVVFISVRGVHIHHFAWGIIILTAAGLYNFIFEPKGKALEIVAASFGVGLALAYDEFGMWLRLKDYGVARYGYDAVIILTLLFLNVIYFSNFWNRMGKRFFASSR